MKKYICTLYGLTSILLTPTDVVVSAGKYLTNQERGQMQRALASYLG